MRWIVVFLCVWPLALRAEVFAPQTAPGAVVVHPNVARVVRDVQLDMPQGQHEVRLSDLPSAVDPALISFEVGGASLRSQVFRQSPLITSERLDGPPAVRAARRALEQAEADLAALSDQIAQAEARAAAAEARVVFLSTLGQPEDQPVDVDALSALGDLIEVEGAAARQAAIAARADIRALQAQEKPLQDALTLARDRFDRVVVPYEVAQEVSLSLAVPQSGTVTVRMEYWVFGAAWRPRYRLDFDPENGQLTIARDVLVTQNTGEDWLDVALQVTTIPASGRTAPADVPPRQLVISPPAVPQASTRIVTGELADALGQQAAAPTPELVLEEPRAQTRFSGAGVSYVFDDPVTVASRPVTETTSLALAPLSLAAESTLQAVPLFQTSAFRVLTLDNATGERILASRDAVALVDGQVIGQIRLPDIEAGEVARIGFGPVHDVQLSRAVLDKQSGDRGVINRDNAQTETVRLSVENLGSQDRTVILTDRVPFSEQEDLEIRWSATPAPARQNVDDKRGVLEWDLTVPAGQSREVILETDIRWPEGQVLR